MCVCVCGGYICITYTYYNCIVDIYLLYEYIYSYIQYIYTSYTYTYQKVVCIIHILNI